MGFQTHRDSFAIDFDMNNIKNRATDLRNLDIVNDELYKKYSISDNRDWKLSKARNEIQLDNNWQNKAIKCGYRPFDNRWTYFVNSKGFMARPTYLVQKHFLQNNLGLIINRTIKNQNITTFFVTKNIIDLHIIEMANASAYVFPLYLYPDENSLTNEPVPNFNMDIIKDIEKSLNLNFGNWTFSQRVQSTRVQSLEKAGGTEVPLPKEKIGGSEVLLPKKEFQALDLFDYIYAVLHSPSYREKYKEFLKIDFPRVPYPKPETFWQLVSLGGKLRSLHLLEDTSLDERIIDIKGEGELLIKNSLNKKDFSIEDEKVELRLNDEVSVVNIPLVAWEFYIGGYQPAQKWLKDRVGRVLNRADMKHYNRIINALCKTDLIMKKIDEVL